MAVSRTNCIFGGDKPPRAPGGGGFPHIAIRSLPRLNPAQAEAELDRFHRLRHAYRCRGARNVRAEIIPVEPVWVMPAEGADERTSAESTRAVFRDHLRL
jgi:hypothetical protein